MAFLIRLLRRENTQDCLWAALAQLANAQLNHQEAFRQVRKILKDLGTLRSGKEPPSPEEEGQRLMKMWEGVYGKLDDPATQERIRLTAEALLARAKRPPTREEN